MKITALKPRMLSSLRWWIRVSRNTFKKRKKDLLKKEKRKKEIKRH